jgi:hypothetical protein
MTCNSLAKETPMITAIVLYDMPKSITREQCLAHYRKIAPGFLEAPGFVRKQFIYGIDGKVAGGVYMWKTLEAAKTFYSGAWLDGIKERYGNEPRITYFETFAVADQKDGVSYPVSR